MGYGGMTEQQIRAIKIIGDNDGIDSRRAGIHGRTLNKLRKMRVITDVGWDGEVGLTSLGNSVLAGIYDAELSA